jgi:hypothetical protein
VGRILLTSPVAIESTPVADNGNAERIGTPAKTQTMSEGIATERVIVMTGSSLFFCGSGICV